MLPPPLGSSPPRCGDCAGGTAQQAHARPADDSADKPGEPRQRCHDWLVDTTVVAMMEWALSHGNSQTNPHTSEFCCIVCNYCGHLYCMHSSPPPSHTVSYFREQHRKAYEQHLPHLNQRCSRQHCCRHNEVAYATQLVNGGFGVGCGHSTDTRRKSDASLF